MRLRGQREIGGFLLNLFCKDESPDAMCEVMNEIKKDELDHVTIKNEIGRAHV